MVDHNLDNLVSVVLWIINFCKSTTLHFYPFSFNLLTFFVVISLSSLCIYVIRKIFD